MASTEPTLHQRAVDGMRTALGVGGLVALVIGVLILLFPVQSGGIAMGVVAAIVALYTLVVGAVYLGSALFTKSLSGWARTGNLLLGALYLVAGIVVMINLGAAAAFLGIFLGVLVGVMWLIEGVIALTALKQSPNRVWTIVYGAVSIIAGLVLVIAPLMGAVTLWLLLGISMVVMGAIQMGRAFSLRAH
ncbi:DUF308 domain-containing protein [Leucobacter sp. CSA1]|uniref:DUF308 domain-containing protein n=1 Tax=Leucobacter chromiisoli TaxID=2796471 RepID=A0A934QB13_9MICO|nr:DUF308 domain-containing protein [Leucobacter chromiisoli]MBK0419812.1 DUF308 domain-containing protein [Leucobacter chromiisoli]